MTSFPLILERRSVVNYQEPVDMKKQIVPFFIALACLFSTNAIAQKNNGEKEEREAYKPLRELYEAGKFDRLEFKAYNFIINEKHKKHPLPYLYLSLANYELSKMDDPKVKETFPRAFSDAVKYAVSFKRKDRKKEYTHLYPEHFEIIEKEILATAEGYYEIGKYKKARTQYKRLVKLVPTDPDAWLSKTLCELQLNLKSDAKLSFQKAQELATMQESFAKLTNDQQDLIKDELSYGEQKNEEPVEESGEGFGEEELPSGEGIGAGSFKQED